MTVIDQYYEIINFRLANPLPDDAYGELHHIKPKSLYDELKNDPSNIVKLLPEEHYKVHSLLPEIYKEAEDKEGYHKMLCAWNRMRNNGKYTIDEQAAEYARLRREFIKLVSEAKKAYWTDERKKEFSKAKSNWWTPERRTALSENCPSKRPEARKKMSEAKLGKTFSEEHKKNLGDAHRGKKYKHTEEYYLNHPDKRPNLM